MPPNSFNPFGIKAKPGEPSVVSMTVDIVHNQPFRKYNSFAEAFDTAGTGNSLKINGTTITAVSGSGSVCLTTSCAPRAFFHAAHEQA